MRNMLGNDCGCDFGRNRCDDAFVGVGMSDIDRATKAKAILESPVFVESFDKTRAKLIDALERCSLTETQQAEDLRRCLRLLKDVRTNLEHAVNTGKLESFQLAQDEKRKKSILRKYF